ncbi:MAG: hypothetical protein ACR2GU_12415 [Rubrobacteraceae bacterium]
MPATRRLATLLLAAAIFIAGCGENQGKQEQQALQSPAPAKTLEAAAPPTKPQAIRVSPGSMPPTSQGLECRVQGSSGKESRVGDFAAPKNVPEYKVLVLRRDRKPAGGDHVRVGDLLVDTRAKSERKYALIARDIKVRYAKLDAITVEFTDFKERGLRYDGGALIFSTVCGALHLGYERGRLPSNGFVVSAGEPPSLYPTERFHPTGPRGLSSSGG